MKFMLIIYFSILFLCIECGLIKNVLGTESDKVHQVSDGNIIKNVHMVRNETRFKLEDLGDELHIRNNKNKEATGNTENSKDKDVQNTVTTPATIELMTYINNEDESMQPNNQNVSTYPVTETALRKLNDVNNNENQQSESSKISTGSSDFSTLIFTEENYHYDKEKISTEIARYFETYNITKDGSSQQKTQNVNDEISYFIGDDDDVFGNENINLSLTDVINLNDDISQNLLYFDSDLEVLTIADCPKGQKLSLDGLCEVDVSTEKNRKIETYRDNFIGCLFGLPIWVCKRG